MNTNFCRLPALCLSLIISHSALGAHHEDKGEASLFHKAFQGTFNRASEKTIDLAKAFSEEQFDWRPAEGIRSVRESILHIASGNYGIGRRLGLDLPEGIKPRELEDTIHGKDATIAAFEKSIRFALKAANQVEEAELGEMVNFFGNQMPKMAAIMILNDHTSEHLGQLIAYARSNEVIPPWSQ